MRASDALNLGSTGQQIIGIAEELMQAIDAMTAANIELDEAQAAYDDAMSEALAGMSKADGAEDQRKAKARNECSMVYMKLLTCKTNARQAEARYLKAKAARWCMTQRITLFASD